MVGLERDAERYRSSAEGEIVAPRGKSRLQVRQFRIFSRPRDVTRIPVSSRYVTVYFHEEQERATDSKSTKIQFEQTIP